MKTKIFSIATIICLGTVFQGCEKEENDMGIIPESPSTKKMVTNSKTNGPNYIRETFVFDEDTDFCDCLPPATDCLATVVIEGLSATLNTFFDGTVGDYIPSSFDNDYELATSIFDSSLVDEVISEDITVRMHTNSVVNNNIYIMFEDQNDELIQAYEYH